MGCTPQSPTDPVPGSDPAPAATPVPTTTPLPTPEIVARNLGVVHKLIFNQGYLYYRTSQSIGRVPASGGTLQKLADVPMGHGLAVDDQRVYYTRSSPTLSLYAVSKTGGSPEQLAEFQPIDVYLYSADYLASNAETIFVTCNEGIYAVSKSGGSPVVFEKINDASLGEIVATEQLVFYGVSYLHAKDARAAGDNQGVISLCDTNLSYGLCLGTTDLFFADKFPSLTRISRIPHSGGNPETLVSLDLAGTVFYNENSLLSDGAALYIGTNEGVLRYDLVSAARTTVALTAITPAKSLTVDDTFIYYYDDYFAGGNIRKARK